MTHPSAQDRKPWPLGRLWRFWAVCTCFWMVYCALRIATNLDALVFFARADYPRLALGTVLDVLKAPAAVAVPLVAGSFVARLLGARRATHQAGARPPNATQ